MGYSDKKTKANSQPPMPEEEIQKFVEVLYVQSTSKNEKLIYRYLTTWLDNRGISYKTDAVGNILITKGKSDAFPVIAAHMDTVHDIKKDFEIIESEHLLDDNTILEATSNGKPTGIGGDDKCGVYSVLYMLEKFDNIKAVFFTKEESGCVGSHAINHDFFTDAGYIIQLDRWGFNDFVCKTYSTSTISESYSNIATPILEKYGYAPAIGLITDSITLFNSRVGISCVNVSCGYYEHHTDDEMIDLNEFWHSIKFAEELITTLGQVKYPCLPEVRVTPSCTREWRSSEFRYSEYDNYYGYGGYGEHDSSIASRYATSTPSLHVEEEEVVVNPPVNTEDAVSNYLAEGFDAESLDLVLHELKVSHSYFLEMDVFTEHANEIAVQYLGLTNDNLFDHNKLQAKVLSIDTLPF